MKLLPGIRIAAAVAFGLGLQGAVHAQACTPTLNTSIPSAGTLSLGTPAIGCTTVGAGDYGIQWFFNVPTGTTSILVAIQQLNAFNGVFELWNYNDVSAAFQLPSALNPVSLTVPPATVGDGLLFQGDFSGLYKVWAGPIKPANTFAVGGGSYEFAVTAVPEPHEWAMMLAGLALVAWAARRRRASAAPTGAAA